MTDTGGSDKNRRFNLKIPGGGGDNFVFRVCLTSAARTTSSNKYELGSM